MGGFRRTSGSLSRNWSPNGGQKPKRKGAIFVYHEFCAWCVMNSKTTCTYVTVQWSYVLLSGAEKGKEECYLLVYRGTHNNAQTICTALLFPVYAFSQQKKTQIYRYAYCQWHDAYFIPYVIHPGSTRCLLNNNNIQCASVSGVWHISLVTFRVATIMQYLHCRKCSQ